MGDKLRCSKIERCSTRSFVSDVSMFSLAMSSGNLSKTILQGTLQGSQRRGGQRKKFMTGHPVQDL